MKNKQYIALFIFTTALCAAGFSQPIINERYEIDGTTNSIFGSVISTDSCYYVAGMHSSSPSFLDNKGTFIKFNLDGTINHLSSIENDTMAIDLWQSSDLIKSLDGNFASFGPVQGMSSPTIAFMFHKIAPSGDTLVTKYYNGMYLDEGLIALGVPTLLQNSDSSYFGLASVYREDDYRAPVFFFKLDKLGNLIFYRTYYGSAVPYYRILKPYSMIRYAENELIIGAGMADVSAIDPKDRRYHPKLIKIDTLGNVLDEHIFWEDTFAIDCNSLTKTSDGGLLFCGRNGRYFPDDDWLLYKGRIVKLKHDFTVEWELETGNYLPDHKVNLHKILPLENDEFVAVGTNTGEGSHTSWLVKFNLTGEVIWERKHIKIPLFGIEDATHYLYDIDRTTDSGFVMVGESTNYYITEDLPGQKAWLLKVDKYGCLVPGCQLNDNPVDTTDTTVVDPPDPPDTTENDPITWLYPNPTNNSLFYYHHQNDFKGGTAYIYNSAGQMVQKWEITENDITYEVDVSQLAAGSYILKVFNMFGEALETERFVKN